MARNTGANGRPFGGSLNKLTWLLVLIVRTSVAVPCPGYREGWRSEGIIDMGWQRAAGEVDGARIASNRSEVHPLNVPEAPSAIVRLPGLIDAESEGATTVSTRGVEALA